MVAMYLFREDAHSADLVHETLPFARDVCCELRDVTQAHVVCTHRSVGSLACALLIRRRGCVEEVGDALVRSIEVALVQRVGDRVRERSGAPQRSTLCEERGSEDGWRAERVEVAEDSLQRVTVPPERGAV